MQTISLAALLLLSLSSTLGGQSYVGSPFYQVGGSPGSIRLWNSRANDVSFDISATETIDSRGRGWSESMYIDGPKQRQVIHRFVQFDNLRLVFGYDLLLEPVAGTTKVRCSFSALTDPDNGAFKMRDHTFAMTPLSSDLPPVVVERGGYISIAMLPGSPEVGTYLEALRIDLSKDKKIPTPGTAMSR